MNRKLTDAEVDIIRKSRVLDKDLAQAFDVDRQTILRARIGKTFKSVKTKPLRRSRTWGKY